MDDELVLLTSYFNLAGGRRQDTADTFRVDPSLSSTTSPDGVAALYVVTESSTRGQVGPRARRLAADTVAWEYSSHADVAPAQRLKTALRTSHEEILREFEGHVSVGISVIAVERDSIYLAQAAPAQVYVLHDGSLHSIAASAGGTSPFARSLGSSSGPKISVFRDQIAPGDVLALCSSWFHRGADPEELRECFSAGTADDIAECILELAKEHDVRDSSVIVIEAALASELEVESDEDEPPTFMEQIDTAVASLAGVGRMLWDEFRTIPPAEDDGHTGNGRGRERRGAEADVVEERVATREPRPAADEPDTANRDGGAGTWDSGVTGNGGRPYVDDATMEMPRVTPDTDWNWQHSDAATIEAPSQPVDTVREQATEEVPAVAPEAGGTAEATASDTRAAPPEERDDEVDAPSRPARRRRGTRSIIRQDRRAASPPEPEREPEPAYRSELDQVNARIKSDPEIGDAVPPVQAFPDTSTEPSRIYATSKDFQSVNRRPRRFGGRDALSSSPVIRPGSLGDIDLRQPMSRPTPGWMVWGGAIACFLLFAVAVALYMRHRSHTVAINHYPAFVQTDLLNAVAATAPNRQEFYLAKARSDAALAQLHGSTPAKVSAMRAKIQTTADTLHHVTRVSNPVTLTDFSKFPGARPTEIATAPGLVFVLDQGRKAVFSVTPNATSNPAQVVQAGETDSGFTIGIPQQLASSGNTALVMDDHNVLVRDSAGTKTATSLTLGDQNQKVSTMGSTGPDVYLLDTATSQLWRYPYGVAGFNPPPQAFFSPNKPDLTHSISFAFDGSSLFILDANGTVRKFAFLTGNPQPFTLHLRTPLKHPATLFTVSGSNFLWITDPGSGSVVQVDKSGNYSRTYVTGTGSMDLTHAQSMSVGPAGNTIYLLSGSKLYDFPVVH
ncbi:MAG TPA: hypothetical protein VF221_04445 [Chloroflexota bacterium]